MDLHEDMIWCASVQKLDLNVWVNIQSVCPVVVLRCRSAVCGAAPILIECLSILSLNGESLWITASAKYLCLNITAQLREFKRKVFFNGNRSRAVASYKVLKFLISVYLSSCSCN